MYKIVQDITQEAVSRIKYLKIFQKKLKISPNIKFKVELLSLK